MANREEKTVEKVTKEGSGGDGDDNVSFSAIDRGKKKVEDSDDVPISAIDRGKKKVEDSDNVPISATDSGKKRVEDSDAEEVFLAGSAMPSQVKKEESSKGEKRKGNEKQNTVKREKTVKKVYDLPSQKYDPPEESDPWRLFYESQLIQNPDDKVAKIWMMERGLLPEDEAREIIEKKKQKRKSPGKPPLARKSPAAKSPVKRSLDTSSEKKPEDNSPGSKKLKEGSDSEEDEQ